MKSSWIAKPLSVARLALAGLFLWVGAQSCSWAQTGNPGGELPRGILWQSGLDSLRIGEVVQLRLWVTVPAADSIVWPPTDSAAPGWHWQRIEAAEAVAVGVQRRFGAELWVQSMGIAPQQSVQVPVRWLRRGKPATHDTLLWLQSQPLPLAPGVHGPLDSLSYQPALGLLPRPLSPPEAYLPLWLGLLGGGLIILGLVMRRPAERAWQRWQLGRAYRSRLAQLRQLPLRLDSPEGPADLRALNIIWREWLSGALLRQYQSTQVITHAAGHPMPQPPPDLRTMTLAELQALCQQPPWPPDAALHEALLRLADAETRLAYYPAHLATPIPPANGLRADAQRVLATAYGMWGR
jgi:hypothetical protein